MSMVMAETTRVRGSIIGPTWGGFTGSVEIEDVPVMDSVSYAASEVAESLASLLKRRGGDFAAPRFHPSTELLQETSRKTWKEGSWECVTTTRGLRLGDLAKRHPELAVFVAAEN